MRNPTYLYLFICAIGLAYGQILFKLTSRSINGKGSLVALLSSPYLWSALTLYGAMTMLWIWILSRVELSRAYPFMALGFIIVPIAGVYIFGEQVSTRYWAGAALIVAGLFLTIPKG